jgi:hypothetical protein
LFFVRQYGEHKVKVQLPVSQLTIQSVLTAQPSQADQLLPPDRREVELSISVRPKMLFEKKQKGESAKKETSAFPKKILEKSAE